MALEQRIVAIKTLEEKLSTKIICYLTGDRQGLPAQIGSDATIRFRRHLENIGEVESICLYIYSHGGDTNVPWRLVNLIREYCNQFYVLIPYCAHSAATLICLGANKIYMGKMGELSPVDPSVANQFNPQDPTNPMARIPISVEDVNYYKRLANRFGVNDDNRDGIAQVFSELTRIVSPLALGNIERSYNQIRKLAESLLRLHMNPTDQAGEDRIKEIISTLTENLYSHLHLINRREAKEIGLNIEYADNTLDLLLWKLFEEYKTEMELDTPFDAKKILGENATVQVSLKRAFIESLDFTDTFSSKGSINRLSAGPMQLPPNLPIPQNIFNNVPLSLQIDQEHWSILR